MSPGKGQRIKAIPHCTEGDRLPAWGQGRDQVCSKLPPPEVEMPGQPTAPQPRVGLVPSTRVPASSFSTQAQFGWALF